MNAPAPEAAAQRARVYPGLGGLLGLGAPLGLVVLRASMSGAWPTWAWLTSEVQGDLLTYAYLILATPLVFAVVGTLLARSEQRLLTQARTDVLTGLANRALFEERLRQELAATRRYGAPLALLMIDVDGLKRINDTDGHKAGDVALAAVGESIRHSVRATDFPARLAGDEFVVLAPNTHAKEAMAVADRIRARLEAGGAAVTVSVGVADTESTSVIDGKHLLERADKALYQAKSLGRNRAQRIGGSIPPLLVSVRIVRGRARPEDRSEE